MLRDRNATMWARRAGLAAALVLLTAPLAGAEEEREPTPPGRIQIEGAGRIDATGHMVAYGLLEGPGMLVTADRRGGGVEVRVTVRRTPRGPAVTRSAGRVRVPRGASLRFLVTGRRFIVRVTSPRLAVSIAGHGRVAMQGDGRYRLDSGAPEGWDPGEPVVLGAGPPEPERRRPAPEDRPPEY